MKKRFYPRPKRERGIVMLFSLIVLVILLAGGVAVMRSMTASLSVAGNLAFKRDLVNQGEQAAADALALLKTGVLAASGSGLDNLPASNYSAARLASNARGIPNALIGNDATFAAVGSTANDVNRDSVRVRYMVDRQCNAVGAPTQINCVYSPSNTEVRGGSAQEWKRPDSPGSLIYRLTVRDDGPRNTQVFLQSSFTKPE